MDDLLQDDYDTVGEVNLAEPNEKKDDTAAPSEMLVPKYQAGESASEGAKLKPPQAAEQVPRDRLVKLQGTLSGNIKDGGNVEDDARLLELDRYLPRLLFHREELRSLIRSTKLRAVPDRLWRRGPGPDDPDHLRHLGGGQ